MSSARNRLVAMAGGLGALRSTCALALAAFLAAAPAGAMPISPFGFDGSNRIEGFEGLTAGPNVGVQLGLDGVYLPGTTGAYTFASGVTLSGPNVDVFPGDAFVHDFRSGSPPANDWGANGRVDSADDVPVGTAYLAVFQAGTQTSAIEFRFADAQHRVGAFVNGDFGTTITLEVYDVNDVLLESATVASGPVDEWGTNFVGIERAEEIWRVVFRGHDFGLDQLVFGVPPTPIPEPSTGVLAGFGLALL
ncbi:MAG TPA: hypothetical protein VHQ66_12315, partial [Myxococcota bacterium]|nr:hypothetical protein [Myxococcota bacterium]